MTTRNLPTATPLLFVGFALDRDDFVLRRAQPGEPHNVEAFVRSQHALRQHIANGGWFRQTHDTAIERLFPCTFEEAEAAGFATDTASFQPGESFRLTSSTRLVPRERTMTTPPPATNAKLVGQFWLVRADRILISKYPYWAFRTPDEAVDANNSAPRTVRRALFRGAQLATLNDQT